MDCLKYGDCWFRVAWAGHEGNWLAFTPQVEGLRARGETRWEAFSELNKRLFARMDWATQRAIMGEVRAG